jgi:hypothetical protein
MRGHANTVHVAVQINLGLGEKGENCVMRNVGFCGLVVGFRDFGSRGPGLVSRHYQIISEVVDLELGPLSLEELLKLKLAVSV